MERIKMPKCKCGCGLPVTKLENKFLIGHNLQIPLNSKSEQIRREKISAFQKIRFENPEARKKQSLVWKGRHHTKESCEKMAKLATERELKKKENGWKFPESGKLKISQKLMGRIAWNKGLTKETDGRIKSIPITEKQKKQISKTLKKYFLTHPATFTGKSHTKESKEKNRNAHVGKWRGSKASNWQGGICSLPYAPGWTSWFIEEIRTRDNHKCQNPKCIKPHNLLDVHHIDYNKENHNPVNLITLCKKCHGKTQKNRKFWKEYYQQINGKHKFTKEDRLVIP